MADVIKPDPYDHPHFTIKRQETLNKVTAAQASATDFAHFRTRNKALVTHVIVSCQSLPSAATTWTLRVMRGGATTLVARTVSSFSALGDDLSAAVITIPADGTLNSVGNFISLEMGGTEKGKFDVTYEYRFIP